MKKITFLLILLLLTSSVVVFAEEPQRVPFNSEKEGIGNIFENNNTSYERKWIDSYYREYDRGVQPPMYIMYSDSQGFTGSLSLDRVEWVSNGIRAYYKGWVYRGDVQPWISDKYK